MSLILLHSSGYGSNQWRRLVSLLDGQTTICPDFSGYGAVPSGEDALELDVAIAVRAVQESADPVHLVGHSYGGLVALLAAQKVDVASLTVIEPILTQFAREHRDPEMESATAVYESAMREGDFERGLSAFIGYWSGPEAWATMSESARRYILSIAPKILSETDAAAALEIDLEAWISRLSGIPLTIILGHDSPRAAYVMCEALHRAFEGSALTQVPGGHMAPVTHPEGVAAVLRCLE